MAAKDRFSNTSYNTVIIFSAGRFCWNVYNGALVGSHGRQIRKTKGLILTFKVLLYCSKLLQGLKYLKIGACPASQKLLAYRGKKLIYTRNIKIFTCPAARGTRKYERTSAIFEACFESALFLEPGV